jgi:hypothetical protein
LTVLAGLAQDEPVSAGLVGRRAAHSNFGGIQQAKLACPSSQHGQVVGLTMHEFVTAWSGRGG